MLTFASILKVKESGGGCAFWQSTVCPEITLNACTSTCSLTYEIDL